MRNKIESSKNKSFLEIAKIESIIRRYQQMAAPNLTSGYS